MAQHEVKSELPGTFYRRPGPGEPFFTEPGATVTPETVIGTVELMKQFNDVVAGVHGTLLKFVAEHDQSVDADDVLAIIDTDGAA